ncbi:MAG: hypothetical protein COX40_06960 [Candidatus Omnitrophica bacterium CG23_combo_of_CG06-09_8_20_14_all_40_11]|nr:MAG: hypothetical protein COX40_06960 [Candidatus Omnitrophica bacterium CG23_combo_of_CG06-09_8_20_14_all_40_11]
MAIFTKGRRKYLSKNFGYSATLILAAAIASDMFAKFSLPIKIIILIGGISLFLAGFIATSNNNEEGE